MKNLSVLMLALMSATLSAQAATPAPAGGKARISVEYRFESKGKKADQYDSREWSVERQLSVSAELKARAPSPYPALGPQDAALNADIKNKTALAGKAQQQMQPLMQSAEAIMARCGDDEACIEREAMNLGAAVSARGGLSADEKAAGRNIAEASKMPPARFQIWEPLGQQGSYRIVERVTSSTMDPICIEKPGQRCHRDEQRRGEGAMPQAPGGKGSIAAAEVDHGKGTLTLTLPMALNALMVDETVKTDHPERLQDNGQRKIPSNWTITDAKTFTVPLKGAWTQQSGEQVREVTDSAGFKGKLTVRWRFEAL